MSNDIHVLLIDDHPIVLDSYQMAFEISLHTEQTLHFHKVLNGDACEALLGNNPPYFHFAVIDFQFPASANCPFKNGADVAHWLRVYQPDCKLVFITMLSDPKWALHILKSIKPEAFVMKSEIHFKLLQQLWVQLQQGVHYYSPEVQRIKEADIRSHWNPDDIDVAILRCLQQGLMTKEMPEHIPASLSTIEKRKAAMRQYLDLPKASDAALVQWAYTLELLK